MIDLDISIPAGPVTLGGSFRPAAHTPGPAALLIVGSGPLDRDSNGKRAPIAVTRLLADHLADLGIGSLRFDKRGVGASTGDYLRTGFLDNVADARAALAALRARPEVDADRVVVIGHSEGALIAAELAADPALAGVVLLAGPAQSGRDVIEWQARQVADGLPRFARLLMRLLRQDLVRTQRKRLDRLAASTDDTMRLQGIRVNARWFREFMAHDPVASLSSAAAPILAITGANDVQVDPADIDRMRELVTAPFDGHVVQDMSHLLRTDTSGKGVRGYKQQFGAPLDPRFLDLMGSWIVNRVGATSAPAPQEM